MVFVTSGFRADGITPCCFSIDGFLKKNLDSMKERVTAKGWDYLSIISGISGAGKSNFAQGIARYCDENFTEKNIAFSDKDFIRITNSVKKYSSVILDESFQSLNTRVTSSIPFLRIINHLQLIRQKNLFIFLCLPNFFDLSKGVAIFRSSHLFMVYADKQGERGFFSAFDRKNKKLLYIKGNKFLDYGCVKPNFRGRFVKQKAISEPIYEKLKKNHLLSQGKQITAGDPSQKFKSNIVKYLLDVEGWNRTQIKDACGCSRKTIYNILKRDGDGKR